MYKSIVITSLFIIFMGCASHKGSFESVHNRKVPVNQSVDMRSKTITTYILYHCVSKLNSMNEGEVLELITDNNTAIQNDIEAWLRMTRTTLVSADKSTNCHRYYIKKTRQTNKGKSLAMVISNPGLEELLSPLGFALGAELAGINVNIFFQGPAVKVLEKGFSEKLSGMNWFFTSFARDGLAEIGHVPPQEKIRQLKELGAHFYICGPSMDHFGVKQENLIFNDAIIAEYMSFLEVMDKSEIHIFLQ